MESRTASTARLTLLVFAPEGLIPSSWQMSLRLPNREVFTTNLLFNKFVAKNWKSEGELMQALKEALNGSKPKPRTPALTTRNLDRLAKSQDR